LAQFSLARHATVSPDLLGPHQGRKEERMFKVFGFLTKREGMHMQDFIDYYENNHVPLIRSRAPIPRVYKRRYLIRDDELTKQGGVVDFDVMTELEFPDRAVFLSLDGAALRAERRCAGRSRRDEVSRSVTDEGVRRGRARHIRIIHSVTQRAGFLRTTGMSATSWR
jgi:hypothetical protein